MSWNAYTAAGALKTAAQSVGFGTSLPASPVDGQEYVLVDSATATTYQWRFRYNTGSSNTDKWEFVGGTPALNEVLTSENCASASYVALTTAQAITLPRAGCYQVTWGFTSSSGTASATGFGAIKRGAAATADVDGVVVRFGGTATAHGWSSSRTKLFTGAAASDSYALNWKMSTGTLSVEHRYLSIVPVRVS
jgi:hypothetical protein